MQHKVFSLHKKERLSSQKKIEELFKKGSSFFAYPFKVLYYTTQEVSSTQQHCLEVMFSVPKKKIKKATQRNTLKRRMREAYRLNKCEIQTNYVVRIALIYTQAKSLDYSSVEKGVKKTLSILKEKCKQESSQ